MKSLPELVVRLAGEALTLLPPGAVWWERERTLLVADLHLGCGAGYSGNFQTEDSDAFHTGSELDLEDAAQLARDRSAQRLVVLGDLFHNVSGVTEKALEPVAAWRAQLGIPIWLTPGEHDGPIQEYSGELPFERVADVLEAGPFAFTHLPGDAPSAPDVEGRTRLCGHLHPVVQLEGGRDRLRMRCFVVEQGQLILPAFGRMTGGAPVEGARGRRRYPVTSDEVLDLGI